MAQRKTENTKCKLATRRIFHTDIFWDFLENFRCSHNSVEVCRTIRRVCAHVDAKVSTAAETHILIIYSFRVFVVVDFVLCESEDGSVCVRDGVAKPKKACANERRCDAVKARSSDRGNQAADERRARFTVRCGNARTCMYVSECPLRWLIQPVGSLDVRSIVCWVATGHQHGTTCVYRTVEIDFPQRQTHRLWRCARKPTEREHSQQLKSKRWEFYAFRMN